MGLNQKCRAHITGMTPGRIVDYGLKDSMNMGACMAPAAADTVARHMEDFHVTPEEYDRIITGDLGSVGQTVLIDLLREKGIDIADRHMDCGIEIFDAEAQDTHAGGSGCGCSAGDRTCGSIGESGGEIGKSSRSEMKHTLASAVSYW